MRKATKDDEYMQKIFQHTAKDPTRSYSVKDGLCFYKNRVVVLTTLRAELLQEFHDSKMARHFGVLRTFK